MVKLLSTVLCLLAAGLSYADLPPSKLPKNPLPPSTLPVFAVPPVQPQIIQPRRAEPQHSHRCGRCGNVWSHGESSFGNVQAHTCPACGAGPWWNKVSMMAPALNCPT